MIEIILVERDYDDYDKVTRSYYRYEIAEQLYAQMIGLA